jgi:WhiB family transcriptional regulator, redox-sensing transcriptional regulator
VSGDNGQHWQHRAACRAIGVDLFFPVGTNGSDYLDAQMAAALAYCNRCPVSDECLEWALETGQGWGIWGGRRLDDAPAKTRKQWRDEFRARRRSA